VSGAPAEGSVRRAARIRLVLLVLCLGAWCLPWAEAFPRDGDPVARTEAGAARTGAPAALAFVAAFGLGATAALARTRRGLAFGEAATCAAVGGAVTALLATSHPWLPAADRRATWVPIFLPLALMALLDVFARRRGGIGREVTAIRAASGLLAGAALVVGLQPVPAAAALFLGVSPALSLAAAREDGARRALAALTAAACAALALAPEILHAIAPPPPAIRETVLWEYVFRLFAFAAAILSLFGADGVFRAPRDAPPAPPP
jgi:hypothetical protein